MVRATDERLKRDENDETSRQQHVVQHRLICRREALRELDSETAPKFGLIQKSDISRDSIG